MFRETKWCCRIKKKIMSVPLSCTPRGFAGSSPRFYRNFTRLLLLLSYLILQYVRVGTNLLGERDR